MLEQERILILSNPPTQIHGLWIIYSLCFCQLLRKTRIDMSVKLLSHLYLCNQNISDFTGQITPLYSLGFIPLQVAEIRFKFAKAAREINGDWNQLSRGQGYRTTDANITRCPSLQLSSEFSRQISFIISSQFLPQANPEVGDGGWGAGLRL